MREREGKRERERETYVSPLDSLHRHKRDLSVGFFLQNRNEKRRFGKKERVERGKFLSGDAHLRERQMEGERGERERRSVRYVAREVRRST